MITPADAGNVSYTLNKTTFLEATVGHSSEQQEGLRVHEPTGNLGPAFCTTAIAQSPVSNYQTAGFGDLPLLFPDAR